MGLNVAGRIQETRSCGGRGAFYPGFVITSMQSMAYLRWGSDRQEACEVIIPAEITGSSDANSIWNGGSAAMPALDLEHLLAVASRASPRRPSVSGQAPEQPRYNATSGSGSPPSMFPGRAMRSSHVTTCLGLGLAEVTGESALPCSSIVGKFHNEWKSAGGV